jgi:ribosome-binding factor A
MRMEKVNAEIKREIGNMLLLGEIKDPRISFVTVQSVDTSKDLQHARVRFSILSDKPEDIKSATEGLNSCRGYVRKLLAERMELRYTPEVQFIFDKGVQHLANIDMRLREIEGLKKAGDKDANDESDQPL